MGLRLRRGYSLGLSSRSYLLPDKNRSSKQKTPVVKRSNSPVWNYTFIYEDVSLAELSERALELTIWDHDRLASNEFLGGVRFSLATGKDIIVRCNENWAFALFSPELQFF